MATYGIDLGTTRSCIAHVDHTGRAVVLRNAIGEETTPSVVFFESPENVVVGKQAKDTALLAPDLVVELVKREMGEAHPYSFHGQAHTPESVSALILRELARAAGEQTGEEVRDVVITVPAYFGLREREATRKAGQIAGLNVLDVLPEPVAAALDYQALGPGTEARNILVYDLGGGTFDSTVIRVEGDDIHVVCTDGERQLGGADWDKKIIDFLLRGFTEQYPQLDPGGDEQFMQELASSAEQLKTALSALLTRTQNLRFDGSVVQLVLTREHFEEITSELLERTMESTKRAIDRARERGIDHFDDVLLVGGMTIMPAVARTLRERFGLEARLHDPHLAVARGAALFALISHLKIILSGDGDAAAVQRAADETGLRVEQVASLVRKKLATVVPRAFGLEVVDHKDPLYEVDPSRARSLISHLLTANTRLPADSGPQVFRTVVENQRAVQLKVWEQAGAEASDKPEHNTHIGEGRLEPLPEGPAGTPFEVVFHMTEMGLLQVHAREEKSGSEVRFEIQIGGLDETEVARATGVVAQYEVNG
jgi:molecular chaperone DnaK (HSP70)